ncbi:hypothetical protein [endosymbiont of Lamellibrachia barhami]|uniref:hypothetical protein n=1 Tax=endosymbiont of Lamellibrachia barhami TaxID=205975 RepID=UPI0015B22ABA|nr:hypothetical protein [endosymbiont of Lamellibrachia barhami]
MMVQTESLQDATTEQSRYECPVCKRTHLQTRQLHVEASPPRPAHTHHFPGGVERTTLR